MAGSTSTTNFYIAPKDGWTEISSSTAGLFLRVSNFPHTHPYYLYFGASAPSLVGVQGSGTVTFSTGVPTAGQTTTVGTEVYTWRAAAALPFEVTIGADDTAAATNFTTAVNTYSTIVTASRASLIVTLTALQVGPVGNYALATTASHTAVSGAAFTGGLHPTAGILVCHKPFIINQAFVQPVWARVVNPVPNSTYFDGKLRLDVLLSTSA